MAQTTAIIIIIVKPCVKETIAIPNHINVSYTLLITIDKTLLHKNRYFNKYIKMDNDNEKN